MTDIFRIFRLLLVIVINYLLLSFNLWKWAPDLFLIQSLLAIVILKEPPGIYYFVFKGFLIDLFFSEISIPYTLTFFIIGIFLKFSKINWIQKSLVEQVTLILLVSYFLNLLLSTVNTYSIENELRFLVNPFINAFVWILIFLNQRKKWLKNI